MKGKREYLIAKVIFIVVLFTWLALFIAAFYIPRLAHLWHETNPEQELSGIKILGLSLGNVAQRYFIFVVPVLFFLTIGIIIWMIMSDAKVRRELAKKSLKATTR